MKLINFIKKKNKKKDTDMVTCFICGKEFKNTSKHKLSDICGDEDCITEDYRGAS